MFQNRFNKVFLIIATLIAINGCAHVYNVYIDDADEQESFESYLESQNFSGAVYIAEGNQVLLNKGFGIADHAANLLNSPDTKFQIGSITKQFTAAAILLLMEQGLLSIDDYVSEYIEDFPNGDKITLKHLLTHTSGIPNYTDFLTFRYTRFLKRTPDELMAMISARSPKFSPGSRFKYSNSGYVLLGVIIEKVSGMSYQAFLESNIFEPLGMHDSQYGEDEHLNNQSAKGYMIFSKIESGILKMPSVSAYSAGGILSTVNDLAKWDRALYDNSLLNKESTELMFTPALENYALGWVLGTIEETNEDYQSHSGRLIGFISMITRIPESKKLIIVLTNKDYYPVHKITRNLSVIAERRKNAAARNELAKSK